MIHKSYPYYLANEPETPNRDLEVMDKYTDELISRVPMADDDAIDRAIAATVNAAGPMRAMPPYRRQMVLNHCVLRFAERAEELAESLCAESGKPIRDAWGEVTRLVDTFRYASEEAVRLNGEVINMEIGPRSEGYSGMWKHVPVGPCSFISPFNFPLNLVAHKVAPAIAAGCPFVLKPASYTPIGALIIGEILAETELPKGAFSILPCPRGGAERFTTDERLKLLSFTGSPEVGWTLKAKAGKKKVVLELGGNAACVVDEDADIDDAIARIVIGAFYQSGQSCISVQRIVIHESIYDDFKARLVTATRNLIMGDPREENTFIGPLISEKDGERLEKWIASAVSRGAKILCGGGRKGPMLEATLLENVPREEPIYAREAFGPVAILSSFREFDEALDEVNDTVYGLQAGVFTRDIFKAYQAWDTIETGGVIINDIPSWRVDHMPYGGVKESGIGREGIRYAMEEMSEIRLMAVRGK